LLLAIGSIITFNKVSAQEPSCDLKVISTYKTFVVTRKNDLNRRMDHMCMDVFGIASKDCDQYAMSIASSLRKAMMETYTLEQFRRELTWAGDFIKGLEAEVDRYKNLTTGKIKSDLQQQLEKKIIDVFSNPRFFQAYMLNTLLDQAGEDCKILHDNGLSCSEVVTADEYEKYLNAIYDRFKNDKNVEGSMELSQYEHISAYADAIPIYEGKHLIVTQQPSANSNDVSIKITIPVRKGVGFEDEDYFQPFFQRIKRVVEDFWKGDYAVSQNKIAHIRTEIVLSDFSDATLITTTDGDELGESGEGGFDYKNNKLLFKPRTVDYEKADENHIILHEFGHVLGFRDRYNRVFVSPKSCDIRFYAKPDEVMDGMKTWEYSLKLQPDELQFLYEIYGTETGKHRRIIERDFMNSIKSLSEEKK
jgi:hypothetical protein